MRADHRAVARQEIQHAWWDACFFEHLHEHGAADNRLLGGFHNHGISSNNSGRRHATKNGDRKIPRRNHEGDATRQIMVITLFARHLLSEFWASKPPHLLGVEGAE